MLGNSTPPVVILGMHRSGTTLVSELLGQMGVHTGNRKKGHDEAFTFRHVNQHILRIAGAHWARPEPLLARLDDPEFVERARQDAVKLLDQFGDDFGQTPEGRRWGWKDPRTMLVMPVWRLIYPNATVVHVVRSGMEVALSLYRRQIGNLWRRITHLRLGGRREMMLPPTIVRGYQLWELYTRAALAQEQHQAQWLTFKYESLVADPDRTLRDLSEFLGLGLAAPDLRRIAEANIGKGTVPSKAETMRFDWLVRRRLIRLDLMHELGYVDGTRQG